MFCTLSDMSLRMSMTRRTTGTLPPIQKSSWSDVDRTGKRFERSFQVSETDEAISSNSITYMSII